MDIHAESNLGGIVRHRQPSTLQAGFRYVEHALELKDLMDSLSATSRCDTGSEVRARMHICTLNQAYSTQTYRQCRSDLGYVVQLTGTSNVRHFLEHDIRGIGSDIH